MCVPYSVKAVESSQFAVSTGWVSLTRAFLWQVGDQIVEINGEATQGITHTRAIELIQAGGNRVHLLMRPGQGLVPDHSEWPQGERAGGRARTHTCIYRSQTEREAHNRKWLFRYGFPRMGLSFKHVLLFVFIYFIMHVLQGLLLTFFSSSLLFSFFFLINLPLTYSPWPSTLLSLFPLSLSLSLSLCLDRHCSLVLPLYFFLL